MPLTSVPTSSATVAIATFMTDVSSVIRNWPEARVARTGVPRAGESASVAMAGHARTARSAARHPIRAMPAHLRPLSLGSMGLLRHHDDIPDGRRFQMREKLVSIGDDSWIADEHGERAYKVDGKAMRIRDTFILKDRSGREVATIRERKLSVRDKMSIER